MRAMLVFWMCFVIALSGNASTRLVQTPCPMAQGMVMATVDNAIDCCNDAETQAHTGQLCKTGPACPSTSVSGFTDLHLPAVAPVAQAPVASAPPFALSTDPTGVWRPPSFL